ncbi:MAG: zinc ABC transporter solute-binding protein [Deltaproteobacteria bacterium]|nr:zinc ABC transporter solute-binding protein [Deltaproteobacteria bacterium]
MNLKAHLKKNWLEKVFILAVFLFSADSLLAQNIRVVTTIPDLADMTKQIGKDLVRVESLAKGVENPHGVPMKPSFVPKLNRANLLVVMGLEYEFSWLPGLLEVASNRQILLGQPGYVDTSVGVTPIDVPTTFDRAEGDVHPSGNPHYNLDPVYGKLIARNIANGLVKNFPQHKKVFEKNLARYTGELDRWIDRWQQLAKPLKGVKYVSYHKSWGYFADRFGLAGVGTIELKPGIAPTPAHLVRLVRMMKEERVPLILFGPQSKRLPRRLASETGAKFLHLPIMAGSRSGVETYIKMIDYNVRSLVETMSGSGQQ